MKNIRTRLTWHDGVATFFAGMIALVTLAGVNEWGWPLLGSYTSSSLVILLLAVPMCAVGGNAFWNSVAFEHPIRAFRDPYLAIDMVLALVALTVVITALVTGTQQWFLALAAVIGVKWAVATTRHAVESEARLGRYRLVLTH